MEDSTDMLDNIFRFLRENLLILGLAFFGLVLLGVGLIQFLGQQKSDIEFISSEKLSDQNPEEKPSILVDVSGEVMKPGVYKLSTGGRIQDALISAGGLTSNASQEYVAKQLNLAQKLTDGAKLYIPKNGEYTSSSISSTENSNVLGIGSKININSASLSQLDSLPGIGQVTANKIVEARPFSSIDELQSKKIVNKSTFEKIKEMISVY